MEWIEVERIGMEGGLATLWNPQVLHLISAEASRSSISIEIQIIGNWDTYRYTNVYSPQKLEENMTMLRSLSNL